VLLILAFMSLMLGVISDLIRTNRILAEDQLEHVKRLRFPAPAPRVAAAQAEVHELPRVAATRSERTVIR
jgi:hypothetical protein